jgi:microcystin-dependent protein
MTFQQTAAPTGWTKDTTHDNKALRVVSGTAGSGGSVNFTTAFGSQNVGATTLTSSQIPGHTHTFSGTTDTVNLSHSHGVNDPGHFHSNGRIPLGFASGNNPNLSSVDGNTGTAFTGISIQSALGNHNHVVSGTTASTGGGSSHTHSLDLAVSYVDLIICTKT